MTPNFEPTTLPTDEPTVQPTHEVAISTLGTSSRPSTTLKAPSPHIAYDPSIGPTAVPPTAQQSVVLKALSPGAVGGIAAGGLIFLALVFGIIRYFIIARGIRTESSAETKLSDVETADSAVKEPLITEVDPANDSDQTPSPSPNAITHSDVVSASVENTPDAAVNSGDTELQLQRTGPEPSAAHEVSPLARTVRRFGFFTLAPRSIRVRSPSPSLSSVPPTPVPASLEEKTSERDRSAEIALGSDCPHESTERPGVATNAVKSVAKNEDAAADAIELSGSTRAMQDISYLPTSLHPVVDNWVSSNQPAPVFDPLAPLVFHRAGGKQTQSLYSSPVTTLRSGQSPLVDIMTPISYATLSPASTRASPLRSTSVPNADANVSDILNQVKRYSESSSTHQNTRNS